MRTIITILALLASGCVGALQGGTPIPGPVTTIPLWTVDVVAQNAPGATIGLHIQECDADSCYLWQTANADGYTLFTVTSDLVSSDTIIRAEGYEEFRAHIDVAGTHDGRGHNVFTLTPIFPPPPTRDTILQARESFQGAVLHTMQFGDLNWWATAFVSLNDTDRAAYYAQAKSWGDTDITVSWKWDYGESGQPYGSGQLVPPRDFTNDPATFRALVKEVIQHGFVPRVFMSGDDGFETYMTRLPLVIAALRPQTGDSINLLPYVKLQVCYDSCIPGWAGPQDDKTKIDQALFATRQACGDCVIALEFSSGYASTGDGDAWWGTPAAATVDEVDWEGNNWPISNFDQYWQVLDRWLGPAFIRPAAMPASDDPSAPFPATDARFYLRHGTPRGPQLVHCLEPYAYQWVRGWVPLAQVPVAFAYMKSLGCPVIDTPQF